MLLSQFISLSPSLGFPTGSVVKNPPACASDLGSNPGSGRSPGEGNGNPLQHSCLENSMDRGTWWATVHGVSKSWTWLSISTPFLTVSTSLFSVSASLLLPCKQVHQYHLSRFHIYALIYHICFSLSNCLIAFSPLYFWDLHSALILLIGLQTLWGHVSSFLSLILCWSYSVSGT